MQDEQEKINKAKELKLLHQALMLEESEVIGEGVERLKEICDETSIPVIATMLCGERDFGADINNQLIELFSTVKIPHAIPALIEEIGKYVGKRNTRYIIASCWEINYDCSKFLKAFALIATHCNAEELIECLSVFENITHVPPIEDVNYALQTIDNAALSKKDEIIKNLLISCRDVIADLQ
jgi:hypothetical protein